MGESSKFPKSWTFVNQILKHAVCLQISTISSLNDQLSLDKRKLNQRFHKNLPNSRFWGCLSVESQPQNLEFRNNPENFHPCIIFDQIQKINNLKHWPQNTMFCTPFTHLCKQFWHRSGPEVIKLFPCSTLLSTKFIMIKNVKMLAF